MVLMPVGLPPKPVMDATLMMLPLRRGIMLCLPMYWLRMVLGRRTPGRTGVVQQHIDMAECLQRVGTEFLQIIGIGTVRRHAMRINASGLEFCHGLFQFVGFACAEHHAGPCFAQGIGHLQAQTARAAGHQSGFAG